MTMQKFAAAMAIWVGLAPAAMAGEFRTITDRSTFLSVIEGRDLTRLGIRLNVTPEGQIRGRAFGRDVTGAWRWDGSYFCRDLYYGETDLGPNCQQVKINGSTVRFISDRGAGIYADLSLR
jgi:hypothetical protein